MMKIASSMRNSQSILFHRRHYRVGVIGAGRIGKVHIESLTRAGAEVAMVADPSDNAAELACKEFGLSNWTTNVDDVFADSSIKAVVICSPTKFHAEHIERSIATQKHVFCEKPIDLDLEVVSKLVPKIEASGIHFMLGFNRRFDSNAIRMKDAVQSGTIGDVRMVRITSYDPSPPPADYLKVSGGLAKDMMIHDLDMARFLVDDEVEEVYCMGTCNDPIIKACGDIDTAYTLLKFKNGAICNIENSRQSAYGYDQRMEVLGSLGGVKSSNKHSNHVTISTTDAISRDLPYHFFLDRYMDAYVNEMMVFVDVCTGTEGRSIPVGAKDGLIALRLAEAVNKSLAEKRPVKLSEIM